MTVPVSRFVRIKRPKPGLSFRIPLGKHTTSGSSLLQSAIDLEYYRLQRIHLGGIDLKDGDAKGVRSPTEVGTGKAKEEKVPLSEIIRILNERFATDFNKAEELVRYLTESSLPTHASPQCLSACA
jgi:type I restriction enzyme R subunit